MREDEVLRSSGYDNRQPRTTATLEDMSTFDCSPQDSTRKKRGNYHPRKIKPPPNAIIASPGDRQIAYPCVSLDIVFRAHRRAADTTLLPNRPQFPRAKINGTPDGVTSVHIGVRSRAPPGNSKTRKDESLKATSKGKRRNREERGAQRESSDWTTRRGGYGEIHSDVQDGSSTAGSSHSDATSTQADRRQRSIPRQQPSERKADNRRTPVGQQRALPRMTLEQAMAQWEKDHPNANTTSLGAHNKTEKGLAGPGEDWESSGDGPAHDGIYTYDYSGTQSAAASTRGNTSSTGASVSTSKQPQGSVLHVDGTEGPVRTYPPPPEHENAYGVPFGKRLKALVHMRKEAEANGLLPMSAGKDGRMAAPQNENHVSVLTRRPAVMSRASLVTCAQTHSRPRERNPDVEEKNIDHQDAYRIERAFPVDSARIEFSDSTPTQSPGRQNDTMLPHTPSTNPQERRCHSPSAALIPSLGLVTPASKSEPPASDAAGRSRRKPVPTYIGGSRTVDGLVEYSPASIRKHRSESDVQKEGMAKERRRREVDRASREKELVHVSALRPSENGMSLNGSS